MIPIALRYRSNARVLPAIAIVATLSLAPAAAAQTTDKGVTDRQVTLAIETDLFVDDAVPAHRIDVETHDGIVTLSGTVDNILAGDRAVDRAMAVKGVRSVINEVTIDGPHRSDDKIEADVENALLMDPATDAYEIGVSVDHGTVTLTGTVDSWQERQLTAVVTKGVRDVVDVKNNVRIEYDMDRSDYEIKAEIEKRLDMSVWANARYLDVKVDGGTVTLTGTVGSATEKQTAITLAWVGGVKSVNADKVKIDWWAAEAMHRTDRFPMPADAEIEAAIHSALAYDPRVFAFEVDADAKAGTVTLLGTVDNLKARRAAEEDARNTVGVWRVKNHVRVRPTMRTGDEKIATAVRAAFARDPYVDRYDIDIAVIGGKVYLAGDVPNSFERRRAENVASRVNGVIDVDNSIDYEHEWTWRSDPEIREDVKAQLFWSPFVDSDDINVRVDGGVVTLTGTVDDWTEWKDATDNAFEGHAKDVRNQLEITGG